MTQYDKLKRLLSRKRGVTSIEAAAILPSLSVHKRISEMKYIFGYTIIKKHDGKITRYWGIPPKKD